MKWIESTQKKYLSTVVRRPNAKFLLRSSFLHFVHYQSCKQSVRGDTFTFALNILAHENAASSDVCIFHTFRATHIPERQMLVF